MKESLVGALAGLLVVSVGVQGLSSWLRLPSILLLLLAGFLAGPGALLAGLEAPLLDPDGLLGRELLFAVVSLSVGVILFEGGLSLRLSELSGAGRVIWRLISVGVVVTWGAAALAARLLLDFPWPMALLLGALLTVTGPTVVIPLIQSIRPRGRVGTILKWEGITVDPVGAGLAVLVFEGVRGGYELEAATAEVFLGILKTILFGGGVGLAGAWLLGEPLRRRWIPDHLQEAFVLMGVVAALAGANRLQPESGLLAVTAMGVALANRPGIAVQHIIEFKESLRVLLIGGLFLLLGARITPADLAGLSWGALAFAAVLILAARPLAVAASTVGSGLSLREKLFLSWMAPRGIVAASVSAVFALELASLGHPMASLLVPVTFAVIAATVTVYGLTAGPLARALGLAAARPQGVLFMGAHPLARAMAALLEKEGVAAVLVDTNRRNVLDARMEHLRAWHGNILAHETLERIDLSGIGRLLALTSNDEANSLAVLHLEELFGSAEVYQLALTGKRERIAPGAAPLHLRGRLLFGEEASFAALVERFDRGATLRRTRLTQQFGFQEFRANYGDGALPLFLLDGGGLQIFTTDRALRPGVNQVLISLVDAAAEAGGAPPEPAEECGGEAGAGR